MWLLVVSVTFYKGGHFDSFSWHTMTPHGDFPVNHAMWPRHVATSRGFVFISDKLSIICFVFICSFDRLPNCQDYIHHWDTLLVFISNRGFPGAANHLSRKSTWVCFDRCLLIDGWKLFDVSWYCKCCRFLVLFRSLSITHKLSILR